MLEKKILKSENMLQKGARMGAEIEKTSIKMEVQKRMDFSPTAAHDAGPGIGGGDFGGSLLERFTIPTVKYGQ